MSSNQELMILAKTIAITRARTERLRLSVVPGSAKDMNLFEVVTSLGLALTRIRVIMSHEQLDIRSTQV